MTVLTATSTHVITEWRSSERVLAGIDAFTAIARTDSGGAFTVGKRLHVPGAPYADMLIEVRYIRSGDGWKAVEQNCFGVTPETVTERPSVFERLDLITGVRSTERPLAELLQERVRIQNHLRFEGTPIIVRVPGLDDVSVVRFAEPRGAPYDSVLIEALGRNGTFELGVSRVPDRAPGRVRAGVFELTWASGITVGRSVFWEFEGGSTKPSAITIYTAPYDSGLERMGGYVKTGLGTGQIEILDASLSLDEAFSLYTEATKRKRDARPVTVEVGGRCFDAETSTHVGGTVAYHLLKSRLNKHDEISVTFPFGETERLRELKAFDLSALVNTTIPCTFVRCTWERSGDGMPYRDVRTEYIDRSAGEDSIIMWRDENGAVHSPLGAIEVLDRAERWSAGATDTFTVAVPFDGGERIFTLSSDIGKSGFYEPLKAALLALSSFEIRRAFPPSGSVKISALEFEHTFSGMKNRSDLRLVLTCAFGAVSRWRLLDGTGSEVAASRPSTSELSSSPSSQAKLTVTAHAGAVLKRLRGASLSGAVDAMLEAPGAPALAATPHSLVSRLILDAGSRSSGIPVTPEDRFRLLLPRLTNADAWNAARDLFREAFHRLPGYLFAGALTRQIEERVSAGLLPRTPSVLSAGSGFGDISAVLDERGQSDRMDITDLDYAEKLLALSKARRTVLCDVEKEEIPGIYDVVYCSSIHRFGNPSIALRKLAEATGRLIVLKAENYLFRPELAEWFVSNGFVLDGPLNSRFVHSGDERAARALGICNFVAAHRIETRPVVPIESPILIARSAGVEVRSLGSLLRRLNDRECRDLVGTARDALEIIRSIDPAASGLNHRGIWSVCRRLIEPHVPSTMAPYRTGEPSLDDLTRLRLQLEADGAPFANDDPDPAIAYNRLCVGVVGWSEQGMRGDGPRI